METSRMGTAVRLVACWSARRLERQRPSFRSWCDLPGRVQFGGDCNDQVDSFYRSRVSRHRAEH
jgi:hypothetical protein